MRGDEENFFALFARALGAEGIDFSEFGAKEFSKAFELVAVKEFADERPARFQEAIGLRERKFAEFERASLIGDADAGGLGSHVRQHDVKWRGDAVIGHGFFEIKIAHVGGDEDGVCDRQFDGLNVDAEDAAGFSNFLRSVLGPGAGSGTEVEDFVTGFENPEFLINLLNFKNRARDVVLGFGFFEKIVFGVVCHDK